MAPSVVDMADVRCSKCESRYFLVGRTADWELCRCEQRRGVDVRAAGPDQDTMTLAAHGLEFQVATTKTMPAGHRWYARAVLVLENLRLEPTPHAVHELGATWAGSRQQPWTVDRA